MSSERKEGRGEAVGVWVLEGEKSWPERDWRHDIGVANSGTSRVLCFLLEFLEPREAAPIFNSDDGVSRMVVIGSHVLAVLMTRMGIL